MKRWLRKLFDLSTKERKGYVYVMIIMFTFMFIRTFFNPFPGSDQVMINNVDQDSLYNLIRNSEIVEKVGEKYFKFNPNTASYSDLRNLGFSSELSFRIEKYRNNGGRFFKKSDLMKIYGMTDGFYQELEQYIELPDSMIVSSRKEEIINLPESENGEDRLVLDAKSKKIRQLSININTADSLELIKINGIGPVLSSRIIRFRRSLGGFVSMDQLNELYNINEESLEAVQSVCYIDDDFMPDQLSVNEESFKSLLSHPYLNYELVKNLVNYRDRHKGFKDIDEIKELYFMNDSIFLKLQPYLKL